jgi:hypothetical protein
VQVLGFSGENGVFSGGFFIFKIDKYTHTRVNIIFELALYHSKGVRPLSYFNAKKQQP